jgi:protein-tyrosine phosphatase
VVDFRSPREREKRPNNWGGPAIPDVLELPIDPGNFAGFRESFQDPDLSPDAMVEHMQALNRQIVTDGVDEYRRMFDFLLEARSGATVIQCASGKDRTGFGSALILLALGADRTTVEHDYMLTRRYLDLDRIFRRALDDFADWGAAPLSEDTVRPLFDVREEYIGAAFAEMDENFGGPAGYLRDALGMSDARIAALQDLLLV